MREEWEHKAVQLIDSSIAGFADGLTFFAGYDCNCTDEERVLDEHRRTHKHIYQNLNDLGADRWELVSVVDGTAYLKRRVE